MRSVLLFAMLCVPLHAGAETPLQLTLDGEPLDLNGDLDAQMDARARAYLDGIVEVDIAGRRVEKTREQLGAEIDRERLARWVRGLANPQSEIREHLETSELDLKLPVRVSIERARRWLELVKAEADHPPRNATVNLETGAIESEQEGHAIDVWSTLDVLHAALVERRDTLRVQVERTPATRTREELEGADFSVLMGDFSTPYNGNDRERTHNLRVAAEKIDGRVLLPGEVFDYNAIVGERSLANGFKPATVIAGGELVDGVGGGACQIAGSLHAAAYFAGLEIVERSPHSRPSSYIKLGLDAAVSYPNINFRFRNDREFPILVRIEIRGGFARAAIRGAERRHQVSFVRRVDEFLPFEERTVEDPDLPAGIEVLTQRGVAGFEVTTWRILRDVQTKQAIRERSESEYPPTTQIRRVGIGGPAPEGYEPPAGDQHFEYRADEYLTATQGPGIEGLQHVRRAGRTGAPGWTVRQGMPPAVRE